MKAQPDYSIYLVTDDGCLQGRTLIDCVREALEGGVTLVQYRAKTASSAEMYAEALQLKVRSRLFCICGFIFMDSSATSFLSILSFADKINIFGVFRDIKSMLPKIRRACLPHGTSYPRLCL